MTTEKVYLGTSIVVCIWFLYVTITGGQIFDFSGTTANKPTGPGQHFHK